MSSAPFYQDLRYLTSTTWRPEDKIDCASAQSPFEWTWIWMPSTCIWAATAGHARSIPGPGCVTLHAGGSHGRGQLSPHLQDLPCDCAQSTCHSLQMSDGDSSVGSRVFTQYLVITYSPSYRSCSYLCGRCSDAFRAGSQVVPGWSTEATLQDTRAQWVKHQTLAPVCPIAVPPD